jgi:hypothetical protein
LTTQSDGSALALGEATNKRQKTAARMARTLVRFMTILPFRQCNRICRSQAVMRYTEARGEGSGRISLA